MLTSDLYLLPLSLLFLSVVVLSISLIRLSLDAPFIGLTLYPIHIDFAPDINVECSSLGVKLLMSEFNTLGDNLFLARVCDLKLI